MSSRWNTDNTIGEKASAVGREMKEVFVPFYGCSCVLTGKLLSTPGSFKALLEKLCSSFVAFYLSHSEVLQTLPHPLQVLLKQRWREYLVPGLQKEKLRRGTRALLLWGFTTPCLSPSSPPSHLPLPSPPPILPLSAINGPKFPTDWGPRLKKKKVWWLFL